MLDPEREALATRPGAPERRRRIIAESIFVVLALVAGSLAYLFVEHALGLSAVFSSLAAGAVVFAVRAIVMSDDQPRRPR